DAPDADLGPHPPGVTAALQPAGVLPSRAGGLRGPRFPRRLGPVAQGTRAEQRGPADAGADHRRADAGPSARPGGQDHRDHGPRWPPSTLPSRLLLRPPTVRLSAPWPP